MIRQITLLAVLLPGLAAAEVTATMDLCRNAAVRAADAHGVPRTVMLAITSVETRTTRDGQTGPWPWTVNVTGKGQWFASRAAALVHAQRSLAGGETSFDVGCFQLNYRWHGQAFPSIDAMFEPGASGDYAARFLKSLYAETGNWFRAAGLYHSRREPRASRYRDLVARAARRLGAGPIAEPPDVNRRERAIGLLRRGSGPLFAAMTRDRALPISAGGVALVLLRPAGAGLLRQSRPGNDG